MSPEELRRKIGDQEDNFVERKVEGVSRGELRQTACAFANSVPEGREAVLFIGVQDKTGKVIGVGNTDALMKSVRDALHGDCYPPVQYTAEVVGAGEKNVVAIVIPASGTKPHFAGPAFVRVGSESTKASPQQYEELILSRTDKARQILKHSQAIFSVLSVGYKLSSNRPMPNEGYREFRECRLLGCTAHFVSFEDISSGLQFSEPLPHVTITHDHERGRPMVIVTFPK